MVAISLPKHDPDDWYGAPVEAPLAEPRPTRPTRPTRPARALPDRATRLRRRRLAALVAAVMVAVVLAGAVQLVAPLLGSSGGQADPPGSASGSAPVEGEVYVVQPGDTLWTIAERVAPGDDPRPIVAELRERSGNSELQVGEELDVANLG
jgi:hypothetical protein